MRLIDQKHDSIRRYLLGQISDEEGQQLEERFMTDEEFREEVLIVEEDLIQEYFSERLSAEEKEAFETRWAPYHADRLEIARALNEYCATPEPAAVVTQPARVLRPEKFNRRQLVFAVLAAGFVILILGGAWLVIRQLQPDRHGRFAEELTRLNTRPNGTVTEDSVIVPPVTLRSAEIPKINPAERGPVVSLVLILLPDQHDSYQVILRSTNPPEEYTVENLHAVSTVSGRAVVFKIPSALLNRGDYSLEVRGRTSQGSFESVGDYNFQVYGGR